MSGPPSSTGAAEGSLQIRLTVADGRLAAVTIENYRLLQVTRLLAGRSAEEALGLLPRLFAVCRIAQGLAGLGAVERALQLSPDGQQRCARRLLLLGETLLEHASRILLDWPLLLGEAPAAPAVRRLRQLLADLPGLVFPDGEWLRPGGGRLDRDGGRLGVVLASAVETVEQSVFGGPPPSAADAWTNWLAAGTLPAARLLARIEGEGLAGFGASTVAALPDLDAGELDQVLADDADGSLAARPVWRGRVHVTGPWARQVDHPLVAGLTARHGGGVAAHLAARLVETAAALDEIRVFSEALCQDDAGAWGRADVSAVTGEPLVGGGSGTCAVEAARGRLVHRIELQEGRVARYQIVAPTEWNFHPDGPLVRGLAGQPAGADPAARARLLIAALDPCVAYSLEVA